MAVLVEVGRSTGRRPRDDPAAAATAPPVMSKTESVSGQRQGQTPPFHLSGQPSVRKGAQQIILVSAARVVGFFGGCPFRLFLSLWCLLISSCISLPFSHIIPLPKIDVLFSTPSVPFPSQHSKITRFSLALAMTHRPTVARECNHITSQYAPVTSELLHTSNEPVPVAALGPVAAGSGPRLRTDRRSTPPGRAHEEAAGPAVRPGMIPREKKYKEMTTVVRMQKSAVQFTHCRC